MELVVEVVYATAPRCWRWRLVLPFGASVADALRAAPLSEAGLDAQALPAGVGIWGREVPLDRPLRSDDRVEIYRPLLCDPKTVRRKRAERDRAARPGRRAP